MSQKIVLMSSPEYFKVEYAINPWMVPGTNVDLELAKNQWNGLEQTIEEAGAEVKVCLLYTSPSPRDRSLSRMPSSA